jgi:hypothetical protein
VLINPNRKHCTAPQRADLYGEEPSGAVGVGGHQRRVRDGGVVDLGDGFRHWAEQVGDSFGGFQLPAGLARAHLRAHRGQVEVDQLAEVVGGQAGDAHPHRRFKELGG